MTRLSKKGIDSVPLLLWFGDYETSNYLQELAMMVQLKEKWTEYTEGVYDYFPLEFWMEKKSKYPMLFEVMKVVLAVPAIAAGSKRVFGTDRGSLDGELGGRLSISCHRVR